MHAKDEADDPLIADQLKTQVITRSQSQAAEHAQQNELILFQRFAVQVQETTLVPPACCRVADGGTKVVSAPKQQNAETSYLDTPLSEMQELALAHAFVTHKFRSLCQHITIRQACPTPRGTWQW